MPDPSNYHPAVTLRDIARKLGISHVTVSLALRDNPKIPASRRLHIQCTAQQMGYSPSITATALSHYKRDAKDDPTPAVLAWLKPAGDPAGNHQTDDPSQYWEGASLEAERLGYLLEDLAYPPDVPPEQMEDFLAAANVNGILVPRRLAAGWSLLHPRFPAIRLGHLADAPKVGVVADDALGNAIVAFEQMWAAGYRRIGLFLKSQSVATALFRAGFLYARSAQELAPAIPPLVLPEGGVARARAIGLWLRQHQPDAVLLERSALPADNSLSAAGVGVAQLDIPESDRTNSYAGVRRNAREIGRLAVSELAARINDHTSALYPLRHFFVAGTWVDGASLPRR